MRGFCRFLGWFGVLTSLSASARAEGDGEAVAGVTPTTAECVASHEDSQVARSDGRLLDARQSLLRCSNVACPSLIQGDCARWFDEVGEMLPTMVITVRRGNSDVIKVEVEIDGKVVAKALTGQEFSVDPGPHEVTIRVAGEKDQTRQILLARGEKHRALAFDLPVPESERRAAAPAPTPAPEPEVPMERPVPTITYVLAGTAGALAIGGGLFGMMALEEQSNLEAPRAEGGCKPTCTDDDLRTLRRNAWISNGFFIGSAAAAVGALATYVLRPEVPVGQDVAKGTRRLGVAATPNGGFLSYGGTF